MHQSGFISSIWTFDNTVETNYATHSLYRWYGTLVPPLVTRLLQMYSPDRGNVFASFAGSGTVPLECILNNRSCTAIDVHPLALLITWVKTHVQTVDLSQFRRSLLDIHVRYDRAGLPEVHDRDKWFRHDVMCELTYIGERIFELSSLHERRLASVALASTVREVANLDLRCSNHLVFKARPIRPNVLGEFAKKLSDIETRVNSLAWKLPNLVSSVQLRLASATDLSFVDRPMYDLLIAHPPYLGAINYYNVHRLSTDLLADLYRRYDPHDEFWLGYKYDDLRDADISTLSEERYLAGMAATFDQTSRVVRPGGYLAVITGDTRFNGEIRHPSRHFIGWAQERGYYLEDLFIWVLNNKGGLHIARRGHHIDHNYVLIFKRPATARRVKERV